MTTVGPHISISINSRLPCAVSSLALPSSQPLVMSAYSSEECYLLCLVRTIGILLMTKNGLSELTDRKSVVLYADTPSASSSNRPHTSQNSQSDFYPLLLPVPVSA